MQMRDDGLDPFTEMQRFATRLARMETIPSVLEVTRAYLANWTSERISAVKCEDEGSAPFDRFGQPFPLHTLTEVVAVSRALQVRCETLRAGGIAPTPNLVELDQFFLLASAVLVELRALTLPVRREVHALPERTWAGRGEILAR